MFIVVDESGASVHEAHNLKALSVRAAVAIDTPRLAGLGEVSADGAHVWLDVPALRDAAAATIHPAGRADWLAGFDGMITYATSKGWTDEHGRVRAHVEPAQ